MGFWHTGYFEFHEPEELDVERLPPDPRYVCVSCGTAFFSSRDLDVHRFSGHVRQRPSLILNGRELGKSRLYVTRETRADDWSFANAESVLVNGVTATPLAAATQLAAKRSGYADVIAVNGDVTQSFEFEFALTDDADLHGVDEALFHMIRGNVWGRDSIDSFIMRAKRYESASRYTSGIANYLYGVLAREELADLGGDPSRYQGRYDAAVRILGEFDRPPAEAISGLVAFHYNQFDRAMAKTKSGRVSDVSRRFQQLLTGNRARCTDVIDAQHAELDAALSDSTVERVLRLSAIPLDGSADDAVADALIDVREQRSYDQLKLFIVAAEHQLAAADFAAARSSADELRHARFAENWYADFRQRLGDLND